jgi:hypothetical protein
VREPHERVAKEHELVARRDLSLPRHQR